MEAIRRLRRLRAKAGRGSVGGSAHSGYASAHFVLVGRPNREPDEQQSGERQRNGDGDLDDAGPG